jgi:hypothetical protein
VSLRESIQVTMLLAIGYVLHQATPPIMLGMKPDLLLDMLFVSILLTRNAKTAVLAGLLGGMIGALTSTFPGGQIANLVDKLVTAVFVYGMITMLKGTSIRLQTVMVGLFGTLFSGAAFLLTALGTVGLPGSFGALYATVVLPTAALNTVIVPVLYPLVSASQRMVAARRPA